MRKLFLLLAFALPLALSAQQPWEYGTGLGLTHYLGDLDDFPNQLGAVRPALVLNLRYNTANVLAFRANLLFGGLAGDDAKGKYPDRGFSFKSFLFEGSVQAELYPFGRYAKGQKQASAIGTEEGSMMKMRKVTPYIFVGIGGVYVDPKVTWQTVENPVVAAGIITDQREAGGKGNIVVPFGGGLRWALNDQTFLSGEFGWRFAGTDYLDGISASGDPSDNDWYMVAMINFSRSFGSSTQKYVH